MARRISDREDLLRDGTQMPIRGRCTIDGCQVFIGFRPQRQVSLYWEHDPVYQFNADNEMRRVFFEDHRYAAHDRSLYCLARQQIGQGTSVTNHLSLSRIPISAETVQAIVNRFAEIKALLLGETLVWEFIGVDTPDEFNDRVRTWLHGLTSPPSIAIGPNA